MLSGSHRDGSLVAAEDNRYKHGAFAVRMVARNNILLIMIIDNTDR